MLKNTAENYGWGAIMFHWIMAFIIIGMLILGLYMTNLPISSEKLKFYGWHKQTGILILMLVMLRISWRMINEIPLLPVTMPRWQIYAAHFVHWALYAFMILMPLTGWLMSSAAGISVSFFGLFVLPNFIAPSDANRILFANLHEILAWGLVATICLHTAAALQHHFIYKDNILRRMLKP